jgi:glycosyltransferase involved in cell wall biosynthesis
MSDESFSMEIPKRFPADFANSTRSHESDISPVVSIIVPAYNAELYIEKCLASIVAQTLTNIEVILVDDGSIDSTLAISRSIAASDFRIRIFTKKNEGQGAARNFGLLKARGTYICYVDSDDWIETCLCAEAVHAIEQSEADFVNFGFDFILPSGVKKNSLRRFVKGELVAPTLFVRAMLDNQVFSIPWNKLYRRETLLSNGIMFPNTRINEDIYYSRVVAYVSAKAAFIPNILYHALIRPGSTSRSMSLLHFTETHVVLAHERDFFASHEGPRVSESLFSAHVVKIFSYLLLQAAFRISSPAEYRECFLSADRAMFRKRAGSLSVLRRLPLKNQALAILCRFPTLLRGLATVARRAQITPY